MMEKSVLVTLAVEEHILPLEDQINLSRYGTVM